MEHIYVFPGQGAQSSTMLQGIQSYKIPEAIKVYQLVSEIVGFDIIHMIQHGSNGDLSNTKYTQSIMFATNMAYYEILKRLDLHPTITCGHSLGEYCSLVISECITLEDAANLIYHRSRLMSEVTVPGGLYSVTSIHMNVEHIKEICKDIENSLNQIINIALYNSHRQLVIGGTELALSQFVNRMEPFTDYKLTKLSVGQAFHTPLLVDMALEYKKYVDSMTIKEPNIPLILNCTGNYYNTLLGVEQIHSELVKQCYQPVQWIKTMEKIHELNDGIIIEVGPGKTIRGLYKNQSSTFKMLGAEDRKSIYGLKKIKN